MAKSVGSVIFVIATLALLQCIYAAPQEHLTKEDPPVKLTKEEPVHLTKEACLCATTDDLNYVCGSDGKTYDNISELECDQKCGRAASDVTKAHDGKCE